MAGSSAAAAAAAAPTDGARARRRRDSARECARARARMGPTGLPAAFTPPRARLEPIDYPAAAAAALRDATRGAGGEAALQSPASPPRRIAVSRQLCSSLLLWEDHRIGNLQQATFRRDPPPASTVAPPS